MLIPAAATASASPPRKKPFYTGLSFQVLLGVAMAILLGYISPAKAVAMKPLGDAFIRLITMIITLVIFCTLVTGIAGMEDMKKVGRVGGKALLYFELVSTLALLIGLVFGVVAILMRFAPIGAFGAMAFTVGKYGLASLGPLAKLLATLYITSTLFVVVLLGAIAHVAGFGIFRFLWFLREEILVVLATSSSEPVLPALMAKLEKLGCSKTLVGLVVPTGYTFNADGTSLYMTLAALFVAQATNTHLTLTQQFTILGVAVLTSKGASGVQGAAFIALVATMMVIPAIPVAGMALILGIDRFLSMCRAVVNMTGNAVATLVIARWENELDRDALEHHLLGEVADSASS